MSRNVAVSPVKVLRRVAAAIPDDVKKNIIIIGSLAAGYHLLPADESQEMRTKDIDCVLSPRIEAVRVGTEIAESLLGNGWRPRKEGKWGEPGTAATPDQDLPGVRLHPPEEDEFFVELLTVPTEGQKEKGWERVKLPNGDHYGLPSFAFLRAAVFRPRMTRFGIYCARPEFMALGNLLENPRIRDEVIETGDFKGMRRSSKDLGRVLAIAYLTADDDLERWPEAWIDALKDGFPSEWQQLAQQAGNGLRALVESPGHMEDAARTARDGLLKSRDVTTDQLRLTGRRLLDFQFTKLEELSASPAASTAAPPAAPSSTARVRRPGA